MKTRLPLLLLACACSAFAIDARPNVKATAVLKTGASWDGTPLAYPPGQAEVTGMVVEIAPGAETGWHLHPVPSFGMILEGELEVQLQDGTTKRLQAGDAVAEVVGRLHNGRNIGSVPVKIVVFYAGAVGQRLTVQGQGGGAVGRQHPQEAATSQP